MAATETRHAPRGSSAIASSARGSAPGHRLGPLHRRPEAARHAYFAILRSPYAHARIDGIETDRARPLPGVVAVFTGEDFEHRTRCPCAWRRPASRTTCHAARARDRRGHTSPATASPRSWPRPLAAADALELIDVEYEPLPASSTPRPRSPTARRDPRGRSATISSWTGAAAMATRPTRRWPRPRWSCAAHRQPAADPDPDGAARRGGRLRAGRPAAHPLDDLADPARLRLLMTAFVFGIPETKIRVHRARGGRRLRHQDLPLPGGGARRGAAEKVGRPVKWIETRRENYAGTTHGRDQISYVEVGATKDGTITALKVEDLANLGAYLSTSRPASRHAVRRACSSGPYRSRRSTARSTASSRTPAWSTPTAAPAGPRRPTRSSASIDLVARELGARPARGAAAQLHPARRFPVRPEILARAHLRQRQLRPGARRALEILDYETLPRRAGGGRAAQGRLLGIGFSTYVEICGIAPSAWIGTLGGAGAPASGRARNVRVHPTGKVNVTTGSLAARPGARDDVRADRRRRARRRRGRYDRRSRRHAGHARSASAPTAPAAPRSAARRCYHALERIKEKAKRIAAHMLEATLEDIDVRGRRASAVKGSPDRAKTIQEIAAAAAVALQTCPAGDGARPRGDRLLRPAELHLPVRHARRASSRWTPRPARSSCSATSRSTTSAASSTR